MKLQIEYVPIDTLVPYEHNAKQHPQEQLDQIKRSITDYGMNDPIGVWRDNVIVEGHGRWIALKQLGYTEVPIIRLNDLTDEQRREYMIVHNQTTMNSGFDIGALEFEFGNLPDFDAAFYGFDFTDDMPDMDELDAEPDDSDQTVVRLVFTSYKAYSAHEQEIKDFADGIGASVTVGK